MVTGINTDVDHAGTTFHVQTEDHGGDDPVIETLVFNGGEVVASKVEPYKDLLADGGDVETAVRRRLRLCHAECLESLRLGRLRRFDADVSAIEIEALEAVVQTLDARLTATARRSRGRVVVVVPSPVTAVAVFAAAVLVAAVMLALWAPESPDRAIPAATPPHLERSSEASWLFDPLPDPPSDPVDEDARAERR